ncbi:hypothetical protein PIB30_057337 [Stylosanthes scabra]|uniref:Uncharacterized protein n=1 Tax=Stylosanthes scabra TaxID=79078 RepID=A0ABU6TM11_9FABA|nr:hypothetical protein [Stylosanthes scabra]
MATLSCRWGHLCQDLHVFNLYGSNPAEHLLAATVTDRRFWKGIVKFSTVPIFLFRFRILCHREGVATTVASAGKGETRLLRLSNDDGSPVPSSSSASSSSSSSCGCVVVVVLRLWWWW